MDKKKILIIGILAVVLIAVVGLAWPTNIIQSNTGNTYELFETVDNPVMQGQSFVVDNDHIEAIVFYLKSTISCIVQYRVRIYENEAQTAPVWWGDGVLTVPINQVYPVPKIVDFDVNKGGIYHFSVEITSTVLDANQLKICGSNSNPYANGFRWSEPKSGGTWSSHPTSDLGFNIATSGGSPSTPVADFSYSPLNPVKNQDIQFTDESHDSDGTIETWHWQFDDGSTSYQQNPVHSFSTAGNYDVTLTVYDDDSDSDVIVKQVSVTDNTQNTYTAVFTVKDNSQNAISGAQVGVSGQPTKNTDVNGIATFPNLIAGEYQYSVTSTQHSPEGGSFNIINGDVNVPVTMTPGGGGSALTVYVVDDKGNEVEGAKVVVTLGETSTSDGETDEDGKIVFQDLPDGIYTIKATYEGSSGERTIDYPTYTVKTIQLTGGLGFKLDLYMILALIFLIAFSLLGALLPVGIGVRIAIIVIGVVLALIFFLISFGFISFGG